MSLREARAKRDTEIAEIEEQHVLRVAELEARLLSRKAEANDPSDAAKAEEEGAVDQGFNVQTFMERQKEIISKIKQENSKRQEAALNQMQADIQAIETKHATEMAAIKHAHEEQTNI